MKRENLRVGKVVSSFGRHPEYFEVGRIEVIGSDYIVVRVGFLTTESWPLLVPDNELDNLQEGTLEEVREREQQQEKEVPWYAKNR